MDRGAWWATVHGVARVGHDLATKPPHAKKGSSSSKPGPCSLMPSPMQSLLGTDALLLNCRSRQKIGTSCWVWLREGKGNSYLHKCWLDLNWLRLFQSFHLGQDHLGSRESKQRDGNRLPLDTPWCDRWSDALSHFTFSASLLLTLAICGLPEHIGWRRPWCTHLSLPFTRLCASLRFSGAQSRLHFPIIQRASNTLGTQAPPHPMKAPPLKGGSPHIRCSPISPRDSNIQPGFRATSLKEFFESRHMLVHRLC